MENSKICQSRITIAINWISLLRWKRRILYWKNIVLPGLKQFRQFREMLFEHHTMCLAQFLKRSHYIIHRCVRFDVRFAAKRKQCFRAQWCQIISEIKITWMRFQFFLDLHQFYFLLSLGKARHQNLLAALSGRKPMTDTDVVPFQSYTTVFCHLDHSLVWIVVATSISQPNKPDIVSTTVLLKYICLEAYLSLQYRAPAWLLFSEILSWAQNPQRNGRARKFLGMHSESQILDQTMQTIPVTAITSGFYHMVTPLLFRSLSWLFVSGTIDRAFPETV